MWKCGDVKMGFGCRVSGVGFRVLKAKENFNA